MKYYKFLLSITLITLNILSQLYAAQILPPLDSNSKLTLQLEDDEVAIFGYGSLMLMETLHHSEDDPYTQPFVMAKLNGFKRTWSTAAPFSHDAIFSTQNGELICPQNFISLNIEPSEDSKINGMLFISSKENLLSYDDREFHYNRIKINQYLEDVSIIGDAYVYIAKPEYYTPTENLSPEDTTNLILEPSYLDIIEQALDILGPDFTSDYLHSTQPIPWSIVHKFYGFNIDSLKQYYPELVVEDVIEDILNDGKIKLF